MVNKLVFLFRVFRGYLLRFLAKIPGSMAQAVIEERESRS